MSSAFDSEVYAERQRLPGIGISVPKLMRELQWLAGSGGGEVGKVILTLEYRKDVDTSQWWTLHWGGEPGSPQGRFAAANELDLCLFRAAVAARREDKRSQQYAGMTPAHPFGRHVHASSDDGTDRCRLCGKDLRDDIHERRHANPALDLPRAEALANARLIAAAPDLLAACKRIYAHLNARIDAADPSAVPVFEGIADLHDAISKAEA